MAKRTQEEIDQKAGEILDKVQAVRTWHAEKKAALKKMAADVEEEYERRTKEIESETTELLTEAKIIRDK